jgi:16S rRNA G966 N2-methylase RsmD
VEASIGDARTFIANERREFDVIFLDPPFGEDPWSWLLAGMRKPRSARREHLRRGRGIRWRRPTGSCLWRRDKAGRVHYHLFTAPTRTL